MASNNRSLLVRPNFCMLFDGIISLPIALSGYVFLPDLPENSRAFYFTKEVTMA